MNPGRDALGGTIIDGKYEIRDLLGEGGMARVYRAVHLALDRAVAVKVMKGGAEGDAGRYRRFEREARLASRLHHPHILSIIDFGRTDAGLLYIVSEYVPGRMLFDLIRAEGRLPLSRAFGLFHQVLAAVEEAHAARVIHRDLKPENILVTDLRSGEDFVKVLDFGIAVAAADAPGGPRSTVADAVAGTPGYMAPEQITGQPATERSDIYALGVILFELLAGRLPFDGDAPLTLLANQLEQRPLSLARAAPGRVFTEAMEQVVARAMAREPAERFAGVAELRDGVVRAFSGLEPVTLSCDACTRPIDPRTGLCALHGGGERVAAALRDRSPTETRPTVPSVPPAGAAGGRITAAILAGGQGEGAIRERDARAASAFLMGEAVALEIIGEPEAGRSALLEGLARGALRLGMRPIRAGADPRLALSPWHPIRQVVSGALGLAGEPDGIDDLLAAARDLGIGERGRGAVAGLFGFGDAWASSTGGDIRDSVRRAVVEILLAAATRDGGVCILGDDAQDWDRASQWMARVLCRVESASGFRMVLASERGILSPAGEPETIRLPPPSGEPGGGGPGWPDGIAADVLATVAVAGREVPIALLEAVHRDEDPMLALALLERGGWIAAGPDRTVSLRRPSAARVALDGLTAEGLRARHRAVGAALGREAGVFVAARHAAEGGEPERAVELLAGAGRAACRIGDEETAGLVHFQRARHLARWELLWGEDEEPYLRLSLEQGRALAGSGHRLAAEMVLKEVLANGGRYPDLVESARKGLESLGAA